MLFLYPKMMFERTIDPDFLDEQIESSRNHETHILKINTNNYVEAQAVYRGWMKTEDEYKTLYDECSGRGINLINTPQQYNNTHYMHNWYDLISSFTFETYFFLTPSAALYFLENTPGQYVMKNDIKFCGVVSGVDDFKTCMEYIKKYQGNDYKWLCLRKYYELDKKSERRYFVYKGTPHSNDDIVPDIINEVVPLIDSNFYSVDVIKDFDGNSYIVEIGDGQVSGTKEWDLQKFYRIFQ